MKIFSQSRCTCGEAIPARSGRGRPASYCSGTCRRRDYRRKNGEQLRAYDRGRYTSEAAKRCSCSVCGAPTWPRSTKCWACYCAKRPSNRDLSNRIHNAKRKAAVRCAPGGERVDPFRIFERDGWRCRICGGDTPKELRGTVERSAPELDHVVPISRGGQHTHENLQCACRGCNIRKSNKIAPITAPIARGKCEVRA